MKNYKLFYFYFCLFFFSFYSSIKADTLESLAQELNEIREEINNLPTPQINKPIGTILNPNGKTVTAVILDTDQSKNLVTYVELGKQEGAKTGVLLSKENAKDLLTYQNSQLEAQFVTEQLRAQASIDNALKGIDEATKFMQESYAKGDLEGAIAALSVIDVTISDVSVNLPQEFTSEIVQEGKKFSEEEMKKITEITNGINKNKEKTINQFRTNIEISLSKGLETKKLTETIIQSGLKTPNLEKYYQSLANQSLRTNLQDSAKYANIIGKNPSQINTSLKQLEALKSGDSKKFRASQIEKYGNIAGLSQREINQGVKAVYNGNRKLEMKISKSILNKISKNSEWDVKPYTDQELEAIMQEQEAVDLATAKIKESGLNFGKGTNKISIDKLANEVEQILQGKVDQDKIKQIKYNIDRSKYTIKTVCFVGGGG